MLLISRKSERSRWQWGVGGVGVIQSCNEMQDGLGEAGGVLKNRTKRGKGIRDRQAGCDNEVTARDKRVVSGRSGSLRLGIKRSEKNTAVVAGVSLCCLPCSSCEGE